MKKRFKFAGIGCLTLVLIVALVAAVVFLSYDKLDEGYQKNMDLVRREHAEQIRDLVMEYADKSGHLPFEEESKGERFMVLIGRSSEEEDSFSQEDVLKKGATFTNSSVFEAKLGKVLGRKVQLPRDPQKVTTFAPNVYVYFLSGNQFSVVVHLFKPSAQSVPYEWKGNTFHSHTLTYTRKQD